MSEKTNFEWSATKAGGERDTESLKESILRELRENNRKLGLSEDDRTTRRPTLEDTAREGELDLARKTELTRESHQSRGFDVRKVVAKQMAAEKNDKEKKAEKTEEPEYIIVKKPYAYDSDMRELTIEKPKRKEIDVIGFNNKPASKEATKRYSLSELSKKHSAIQDEIAKIDKELAEIEASKAEEAAAEEPEEPELEETEEEPEEEEPQNPDSLIAVGVDWTKSEDRLAKKLARKDLKAELKKANIIKKIWKGRLFREYYEEKYMDEYLSGERTNKNGDSLYDIIDNQKQELMEDIVFDITDEVREINREEWDKKLVPVDKETNEKIKSTIEDYARFMFEAGEIRPDWINDPEVVKEIDDRFDRYMIRILEKAEDEGKINGYIESNNYLDVAKEAANRYKEAVRNARSKVEQDAAMAKVMLGFQAYNYESRKAFSDERKNNLDKVLDKIGTKKIGHFIPAETFSNAIDMASMDEEEAEIVDDIKNAEELIGGEEGIKIMLDKSPISTESVARWHKWWDSLSDDGREYVKAIVKQVNTYPNRYQLKWGNGFRAWLTLVTARDVLGVSAA